MSSATRTPTTTTTATTNTTTTTSTTTTTATAVTAATATTSSSTTTPSVNVNAATVARSRRDFSRTVCATKNLRAISLALVQKLRTCPHGVPSNEVANTLARDAIKHAITSFSGHPDVIRQSDLLAIEKNIRRRLYDSLKVLVSIGAIRRGKTDKVLHWQGVSHLNPSSSKLQHHYLPSSSPPSTSHLPPPPAARTQLHAVVKQLADMRVRLAEKATLVQQLVQQRVALERLCKRNAHDAAASVSRIYLPFVIVRTPHATDIVLESTPDTRKVSFKLSDHFEIVNDAGILNRLFCVDADRHRHLDDIPLPTPLLNFTPSSAATATATCRTTTAAPINDDDANGNLNGNVNANSFQQPNTSYIHGYHDHNLIQPHHHEQQQEQPYHSSHLPFGESVQHAHEQEQGSSSVLELPPSPTIVTAHTADSDNIDINIHQQHVPFEHDRNHVEPVSFHTAAATAAGGDHELDLHFHNTAYAGTKRGRGKFEAHDVQVEREKEGEEEEEEEEEDVGNTKCKRRRHDEDEGYNMMGMGVPGDSVTVTAEAVGWRGGEEDGRDLEGRQILI